MSINGVEYGFRGDFDGNVLNVNVPALRSVLGSEIKNGKYSAKLEAECIMEDGAGYYNLLWNGEVSLKIIPSIKVNMDVDEVKPETGKTKVIEMNDEDVIVEPAVDDTEIAATDEGKTKPKAKKPKLSWK